MDLSARQEFPASCDRVYAMCTDPDFLNKACRDLAALRHTVGVQPPADSAVTVVAVELDTPGPLRPFAGASVTVEQEMAWAALASDGSRSARLIISAVGLPVAVDAGARLAPTASGCTIEYSGTLTVRVPLLGGSLERAAAPFILETLSTQQDSGRSWLAAHR